MRGVGRTIQIEMPRPGGEADNGSTVLARLAMLKSMRVNELKFEWKSLFGTDAPNNSRPFLEMRLAWRIQELAYGGPSRETVRLLDALADELRGKPGRKAMIAEPRKPVAGTRLMREWQGVEHTVTVRDDDFEYQGRPYKSLSAIARAITGTRWNGLVFFGLKKSAGMADEEARRSIREAPLRGLHPQVHRGRAGAGVQQPRRPARGLRGLHRQPEGRGLGAGAATATTMAASPAARWSGRRCKRLLADIEAGPRRRRGRLQDRPAQPRADGFRQAGRGVRPQQRHLRQRHAVVQHDHLDGPADAEHPAVASPSSSAR